jgi:hypothetical protein
MERDIDKLSTEEMLELLVANLSECNSLISALGKKVPFDREELRKLRNDLMFARSKARNLTKAFENMRRPIDSFNLSTDRD